nr:hypothetical protein [Tanacetum cinerariifolium]
MPYGSKYKTAQELLAAILKTFGGNESTKKTKKNLLKQQYGNFKEEGSETLEHIFNRLQVIVGQLQFMDIEIKQDDLNQKFLISLAPEWLMHTIVWRNRSDLDTMSLDDLYNHLKVYESEVQKKSELNSQNIAFISSAKHSSGNEDGNTACVPTASTNVPTASASSDEDDMEEMDIKWNMALLSMRADKAPRNQDRGRRDNYRQGSKAEEQAPKALMAIDGNLPFMANTSAESKVFDNSLCSKDCKKNNDSLNSKITDLTDKLFDANNLIYHYNLELAQVESRLEKEGVDGKLAGLLKALKDFDNLIESQRSDKIKDGLGYSVVPPPHAQLYLSPKKDLSWTGLPECVDDIVTDYSRRSPTIKSTSGDDQNRNPSVSETAASPITPKPFIKFVKPKDSQSKIKTGKTESLRNLQLSPDFVMKKKVCFNYGDFNHLAYGCRKR